MSLGKLGASLIYALDRLFPAPRVGGRGSAGEYSRWEYEVGRELLEEYSSYFGSIEGRRVLDVGCGLGGKSAVYSEAGSFVTGIDIDHRHTAGAREFSRREGFDLALSTADASRLPFRDGSFDIVIANDSMEHFPDPGSALSEMIRVTAQGGYIFVFFTPWGSPLASHLYDYIHIPWCHLLMSERMLEDVLSIVLEKRGQDEPVRNAEMLMDAYRSENNRIDVASYRKMTDSMQGIEKVLEELKPPKFGFLKPLTRIPGFGELFTGTVVSILRKRE